jgi:uncharacterized protein
MHIAYPLHLDGRGRTAEATTDEHVRQLIEQVLFTAPGERVNRPDFGAGLRQLVFGPSTPELAAATEFMVRGALQQWLGALIQVEAVEVRSEESTLRVLVRYVVRRTQERSTAAFAREV